jgi:Cu-Zn family superoxide dismutase
MRHLLRRSGVLVTLVAGSVLFPASAAVAEPARTDSRDAAASGVVLRAGQFDAWSDERPPTAVTYDAQLVPRGAKVLVAAVSGRRSTVVLVVAGLLPNRTYGAHVHVRPCGATGAVAGPHYQNVVDPVQPSVDPEYANPANESWLDFTTGDRGHGRAVSRVGWEFRAGQANSVVIHERATRTEPGVAGTAGARVACVTVPL